MLLHFLVFFINVVLELFILVMGGMIKDGDIVRDALRGQSQRLRWMKIEGGHS